MTEIIKTDEETNGENTFAKDLSDVIEIGFISPEKAEFYTNEGGFVGFKYNGENYSRVSLRRALPLGNPSKYISVADRENKEIGIIEDIAYFSDSQRAIIDDELYKRYYAPEVFKILSIKEKLGYVYLELVLLSKKGEYSKSCAVKDVSRNIRLVDENRLIIFDVDGNRYIVNEIDKLDSKSFKRIEPFLF